MLARKTVFSAYLSSFHKTRPNIGFFAATFTSTVNKDSNKIRSWSEDVKEGETAARGSSVADNLEEGAERSMERGMELGQKAKQTMDDAWDAAKETTNNVKNAMQGGDNKERYDDVPPSDRHVDDLRKRGDGYDLRDGH